MSEEKSFKCSCEGTMCACKQAKAAYLAQNIKRFQRNEFSKFVEAAGAIRSGLDLDREAEGVLGDLHVLIQQIGATRRFTKAGKAIEEIIPLCDKLKAGLFQLEDTVNADEVDAEIQELQPELEELTRLRLDTLQEFRTIRMHFVTTLAKYNCSRIICIASLDAIETTCREAIAKVPHILDE